MRELWHCYAWQGPANAPKPDAEPVEDWTSPAGAVEFLRRELASRGLYSKPALVSALADLRKGQPVALNRELENGTHLHLTITRESVDSAHA